MTVSNSAFVGSIPEHYDKYLGPLVFEEYSIDLASRLNIPDGGSLLEIAAGTGLATRHMRNSLPENVSITVTDLNEPMLEIAKKKFSSTNNMHFQTADAANLSFDDASFDTIACQFGIMFFPDKQKCVNETFRILKPGGEFLFSVWDSYEHNTLIKLVNDTLVKMFPENPLPFLDVPLGYYNIDEIKRILEVAGYGDIDISVLPRTIKTDSAKNVPLGFIMGNPLSLQIPALGGEIDEVIEKVANEIIVKFGNPPIKAPMQAIVFKAHKPVST
ncbi:MAG: class I SAM-dependent methyltransferase [Anaerolineae bacterium]|nr:class I SAM-dependent methyltransferase [Anaerolineae bacterium]